MIKGEFTFPAVSCWKVGQAKKQQNEMKMCLLRVILKISYDKMINE